jgi:hypothetical protein
VSNASWDAWLGFNERCEEDQCELPQQWSYPMRAELFAALYGVPPILRVPSLLGMSYYYIIPSDTTWDTLATPLWGQQASATSPQTIDLSGDDLHSVNAKLEAWLAQEAGEIRS